MERVGVIVISIEKNTSYSEELKKKLSGKSSESYYIRDARAKNDVLRLLKRAECANGDSFRKRTEALSFPFVAIVHGPEKDDIDTVILGRCEIVKEDCDSSDADGKVCLPVRRPRVYNAKEHSILCNDIKSYLGLKLANNYADTGYVKVETSKSVVEKISFYLDEEDVELDDSQLMVKSEIESSIMGEYAQRDCYARRLHSEKSVDGNSERSGYILDYERIVHSKAFRRMVDKAQVFSASKGDHYRTRLTHTLAVAQIARSIAQSLDLNVILVEAIALAHDVGHTPFGHQGERTLNDIVRGRLLADLGICEYEADEADRDRASGVQAGGIRGSNFAAIPCNPYGGFKHNFQSVRVLTALEEGHIGYRGLNLSAQVLEGALWHTKAPMTDTLGCNQCGSGSSEKRRERCCKRDSFWNSCGSESGKIKNYVFHQGEFEGICHSLTLEGQVVAVADEIAQRSHDLDDALAAGLLSTEELLDLSQVRSVDELRQSLDEVKREIESKKASGFLFIDDERLLKERIASKIVNFLIESVVKGSEQNIKNTCNGTKPGTMKSADFGYAFNEKVVDFDKVGKWVCDYLESIVNRIVLNSSEIARFDHKAQTVVRDLFAAYYDQPMMLPRSLLRRMAIMEKENEVIDAPLDLSNCSAGAARDEIKRIKKAKVSALLDSYGSCSREDEEYARKKQLLVRAIVDHISGMTDSYALAEYERIYGSSPQ